jgi:hypothetical protein
MFFLNVKIAGCKLYYVIIIGQRDVVVTLLFPCVRFTFGAVGSRHLWGAFIKVAAKAQKRHFVLKFKISKNNIVCVLILYLEFV